MKVRIAVLDADRRYLMKFFLYVKKYRKSKFDIHVFSTQDSLVSFIAENTVDVVLVGGNISEELVESNDIIFLKLSEKNLVENEDAIYKYQRVSEILKVILRKFYDKNEILIDETLLDNDNKVIAFISSGSGSGASTVSLAFSKFISTKNKNVLFLDMQMFPTFKCCLSGSGTGSMSDVFYDIKSRKKNLSYRLENLLKKDKSNIYFYDDFINPAERGEITYDDFLKLLSGIKKINFIDYIVIDIDLANDDITKAVFDLSDKIMCVCDTSDMSQIKFEGLRRYIKSFENSSNGNYFEKMQLIYNKYVSSRGVVSENSDINLLGFIPKYNEVSAEKIIGEISQMHFFEKCL